MSESYSARLKQFEAEKRELDYKDLTPVQYQIEIRKLAEKYGI